MIKVVLSFLLAALSITVQAQTPRTATLTWNAVTAYEDGTPLTGATYQVYQGPGVGTTKVKVGSPVTALTLSITSGLLGGRTYCWQVSTVVGASESTLSNEACKTFPASLPQAPTLSVQ